MSYFSLHAVHADCCHQTLLLITLLRMNGISARWQSGMVFSDGSDNNIHDWAQVYIAPYGWVPMDVTTGRLPADKGTGNDPGREWFYLGGQIGRAHVERQTHMITPIAVFCMKKKN